MTTGIVEIQHTSIAEGKQAAKDALRHLSVPQWKPKLNNRWVAASNGRASRIDEDAELMIKLALEVIAASTIEGDQRDVYYDAIRGRYNEIKTTFRGMNLKDKRMYSIYIDQIMEKIQLAANRTMQSFGIWPSIRGFIKGDGDICTRKRGRIPLKTIPSLWFDLAEEGAKLESNARKIIHYEKAAGFERLTHGDISKYIEAIFSTSQGYLTDAASKFLRMMEERDLQIYTMHDADAHGLQMQLMYEISSKNSAYMPSEFYPKNTVNIGLFPRVAKSLGLPAEYVDEKFTAIFDNMRKLFDQRMDKGLDEDLSIIMEDREQWEIQALNRFGESAPQIYVVEALRASNDEIKHVPLANEIKDTIENTVGQELDVVDDAIEKAIADATRGLLDLLHQQVRQRLAPQIGNFSRQADAAKIEIGAMSAADLREAVKAKLVANPEQYWHQAAGKVTHDILRNADFEVKLKVNGKLLIAELGASSAVTVQNPKVPDTPLTRTNITDGIERKIIPRKIERRRVVSAMRTALEQALGAPDEAW